MANYNKIILVGNLTRDPQLQYLPSQMAVVEFGLAVNHKFKTKTGEDREEVLLHRLLMLRQGGRDDQPVLPEGQAVAGRRPAEVRHLGRQARRRQAIASIASSSITSSF